MVVGLGFFPVQIAHDIPTPLLQAGRLSLPALAAAASTTASDVLIARAVPLTLVAPDTTASDTVVHAAVQALPPPAERADTATAGEPNDIVRAAAAQPIERIPIFFEYRVQEGDTLSGVASRFGVRSSYVTWNNADVTDVDSLAVGQALQVPSVEGIIHSVRLGETVSEIALRYDADAQDIIGFRANGLLGDPNRLREGSQILVPGGRKVNIASAIAPPRPPASAVIASAGGVGAPGGGWAWPVVGLLTSPFAPWHPLGIDIAIPSGTPIVAASAGTVSFVGGNPCCSYGYHVIIDNGAGYETTYAHLSAFAVKKGEAVAVGQRIGSSGTTGNSSGPHLHFELHRNGVVQDPMQYLP